MLERFFEIPEESRRPVVKSEWYRRLGEKLTLE
jgi:hypothetical protein